MKKLSILAVVLILLIGTQGFGQSTYATVSGTVSDVSSAVLPGVSIGAFPLRDTNVPFKGTQPAKESYWTPGSFQVERDPQCSALAQNLQLLCTLNAIKDAKTGQLLLQNALPGTVPTLGLGAIYGPGRNNPSLNISGAAATNFGIISGKNNQKRELQAQLRFNF